MGSSYFYMEFLLAIVALLKDAGYGNPALFGLEYTLVPDEVYPTQLRQAVAGYEYALSMTNDPRKICVGGDSAGATLVLSLLLYMADHPTYRFQLPGFGMMISPWVTLVSENNRDTTSDYLNQDSLSLYGYQYAGSKALVDNPLVSPGSCKDSRRWANASPTNGWAFLYGSEEVLAPEICDFMSLLKKSGAEVHVDEEEGGIHAWPVAALYLGESRDERLKGVREIVSLLRRKIK
jgi:acetyl esterase/lipase